MLLDSCREDGVPYVTSAKPWDTQQKEDTLHHEAHQSTYQNLELVRGEFVHMIKKRFWTALPTSLVLHHKELRLSPLGVAPQHKQQPQVTCNHTFFGVNQDTVPMAPPEAMQFGKMLPRQLQALAFANPKYNPVYLAK